MGFYRMLVQVTWVGVILSVVMAAAATEYPVALRHCPEKCGDVKIPYPFGMAKGCYLSDSARYFSINCSNSSSGQPQPMIGNIIVTNISIKGEIDILMYKNQVCYNDSAERLKSDNGSSLSVPNFTVSVTKNKFVAVGCDTYAYLNGKLKGSEFSTGCLSRCKNTQNIVNGTCSGIGCCQIPIPEGLQHVNFKAYSFNQSKNVSEFSPCSYAFIIQEDKFKFSPDNLTSLRNTTELPMVLDWAVGNESCKAARNKKNCLCGPYSICIDLNPNSGRGYRCNCTDGYEGNPYLKDGCQDINECEDEKKNNCKSNQKCDNLPGTFRCVCLEACVADQPARKSSLAINLAVGVGIGLIVMLACCSWLYFMVKQRNLINLRERFFKQNGGLILQQLLSNKIGQQKVSS